ncbi:hypothetical protein CDD83_9738 [Cordyceps sp. RAO-2017]|nr:hypothetical protein CDD83_9738 [Cordyceps sp. RAO-2017]
MQAQEFPDQFDGIVAGAPAFDFNALSYWAGRFYKATGPPGSPTFLSAQEWDTVYADILKQCDALDGAVDGILEAPELCHYSPASIVCRTDQKENCLVAEKAATVDIAFSPVYDDRGKLIYPRLQPGCNSTDQYFSGYPAPYPTDWYRFVVYNDSSWDPRTLRLKDYVAGQQLNPFNIATWSGDLSRFHRRRGKLLHLHGLQDPIISSEISNRYYGLVSETMGLGPAELDDFYRYFRISGLAHCEDGTGSNFIGLSEKLAASRAPEENVLSAIVKWVEEDMAPETILGTKFANGRRGGRVLAQRRHCKYPLMNKYRGSGNPSSPESWECVEKVELEMSLLPR